jgi:hypothetical protein
VGEGRNPPVREQNRQQLANMKDAHNRVSGHGHPHLKGPAPEYQLAHKERLGTERDPEDHPKGCSPREPISPRDPRTTTVRPELAGKPNQT